MLCEIAKTNSPHTLLHRLSRRMGSVFGLRMLTVRSLPGLSPAAPRAIAYGGEAQGPPPTRP